MTSDSGTLSLSDYVYVIFEKYKTQVIELPNENASGLIKFPSEKREKIRGRLCSIIQRELGLNDSSDFDEEIVAIKDKNLEHKCIIPNQHRKILLQFSTIDVQEFLVNVQIQQLITQYTVLFLKRIHPLQLTIMK